MEMQPRKSVLTHQCFRILDVDHTHALDLLRGEKTELDLLNCAQGRLGVWEENIRHIDEGLMNKYWGERGENESSGCVVKPY